MDSRHKNRIELFRHTSPYPQHPSIGLQFCVEVARPFHWYCPEWIMVAWHSPAYTSAARQTSICHECCCTFGILCPEIRPHHSAVTRPSLVAHTTTDWVPSRSSRLTVASKVLLHRIFRRSLHRVSDVESRRQASICVHVGIGSAENVSSDNRRPCIFRLRLHASGTVYHRPLQRLHHWHPFSTILELNFLRDPIPTHNLHHLIAVSRITILFCIVTLKFVRTIRLVNAVRFSFTHSCSKPLHATSNQQA